MNSDYEELKKHCSTVYNLYGKSRQIGNLDDIELEAISNTLKRRDTLDPIEGTKRITEIERKQLNSVEYVLNYRRKCYSNKAIEDIQSRRIDKLYKFVNNLRIWNDPIKNVRNLINN